MEVLQKKFKSTLELQGIDISEIQTEWQFLKKLVYKRFGNRIDDVSWESVHYGFRQNGLSNVLGLMDLLHSLPPTSVQNETSFNQMKLIKTDRRHRLSQKHLNDLMMIRLQSPSIMDYDPTTAINKWMVSPTGQRRRLTYRRTKKPPKAIERDRVVAVESERERVVEIESELEVEMEWTASQNVSRVRYRNVQKYIEMECEMEFN